MKRKDLEVGKTYYVSHSKGAYADVFENGKTTCHGPQGVKVLAVEPYEYHNWGVKKYEDRFQQVKSGNGVLVEVTEFSHYGARLENGSLPTHTVRRVIPLSQIIAPWDIAVKQIQENARKKEKADKERAEFLARRAEYEKHFLEPAMKDLTTALTNLHVRLEHAPKHFYRDTRLSEMPLDVIETLTAIINEALAEKVGA